MTKDRDCRGVPAGAAYGGDGGLTPATKDQLRMTDAENGPHTPIWWIIIPGTAQRVLCYVHLDTTYDRSRGSHVWTATAWNADGYRAVYSEDEWTTARLEGLAQPVRPDSEIQRVILHSVEREVITPRCGLELYEETLETSPSDEQAPAVAGEGRHHG